MNESEALSLSLSGFPTLTEDEHSAATARTFAHESELVALSVRIPRSLADGLQELAEESRLTRMPATVSTLAADAIEAYLKARRPVRRPE